MFARVPEAQAPPAGMAQIKNGKVSAAHVYFDNMGFMQQLGLVPPRPHADAKTAPGAQKMSCSVGPQAIRRFQRGRLLR